MIAKAKSIPHGQAMVNYATKNHRADIVKTNLLTEGLFPMGMWDEMELHQQRFKNRFARRPIKNNTIRIEASPSMDESKDWTLDDWAQYAERLVAEMSRAIDVTHRGRVQKLKPIDLNKAQYFAALHHDAKSGIPHLHIIVNRIDSDGELINDYLIGQRAVAAAQVINREMGWRDPMEIRAEHLSMISADCIDVLREIPSFSWEVYKHRLEAKGYEVKLRADSTGIVKGYTVKMGNCIYKASELGKGRNLSAKNIYSTHKKLHPKQRPAAVQPSTSASTSRGQRPAVQGNTQSASTQVARPSLFTTTLMVDDRPYSIRMSNEAHEEMLSHIEAPTNGAAAVANVMNVAMMLFMEYIDGATSIAESSGGGGDPGSNWGRDKDEDDREWARRCARQANWLCKPILRTQKR